MGNSLHSPHSLPLIAAIGIAATLAVVYIIFDPAETWWMPKCPFHFLTGLDCPGCGSQRAVHALFHGNFKEAFSHNALLILMIPYLGLMGYAEIARSRHPKLYRNLTHPAFIFSIVGIVCLWTVIRNL